LYLSRFINQNKSEYYRLLQAVRNEHAWTEWISYMLEGVETTSHQTTHLIHEIKNLMQHHKHKMRSELPKIYSQDLLNVIFGHPYTKIAFVERDLDTSRVTATRYLNELVRIGLMSKEKLGKELYYINIELFKLLSKAGGA
jgi:Fic family protein